MTAKLHLVLAATMAFTWLGQPASGRNRACDDLVDPFVNKISEGISLDECQEKCLDNSYIHCESILYNKKAQRCVLSEKSRSAAPIRCAGSQYEYTYYQRPEKCGSEDLTNKIMSCSASNTLSGFLCSKTYDGSEQDSSAAAAASSWAVNYGKGAGEWIRLNLNDEYTLTAVHILPRCYSGAQVGDWEIEFEDGEIVQTTTTCGGTGSWTDCSGYSNDWHEVKLPHPIRTSYLILQITRTCGVYYNGMREIKVQGYEH